MNCKANKLKSTKGTDVYQIVSSSDDEIIIKSVYIPKSVSTKLKGKKITIQF